MDRRIVSIAIAVALSLLLASCSVVFQAGISGKVVTVSGTSTASVSDVSVFAYTDESLRDSDFTKFEAGTITRPTEGSGYVATTTTDANGEFIVNKVVWETKKSEFGKTADVNKIYLIFYHKDYKVAKCEATVISDSSNTDNVYIELEPSKKYTTINVTVNNVSTDAAMGTACTLKYWVDDSESYDTVTIPASGANTIQISFSVDEDSTTVKYWLEASGTKWEMVDKTGALIDSSTCVSETVSEGTHNVTLYMKNYEFTLPGFSGDIDGTIEDSASYDPTNANDNVPIWLAYFHDEEGEDNDAWYPFEDTVYANSLTFADDTIANTEIYYKHGVFNGVGNATTVTVNEDTFPEITDWDSYSGKNLAVTLAIVTGEYDSTTGTHKYKGYKFSYTPGITSTNLGHVTLTTDLVTIEIQ